MTLSGITVGVVVPTVTRDTYGKATVTEVVEPVENVLVSPAGEASLAQLGEAVTWELHWPKADTRDLYGKTIAIGGEVVDGEYVGGERFAVVGDPRRYLDDLTPGPWDRLVLARHVHEDGDA